VNIDLPRGWTTVTVEDIADLDIGFAFKSAQFAENGIRLLRGENIQPGALRWNDTRYWRESDVDAYRHLLVEPGDLILAMDRPVVSAGLKLARARDADCPCLLVQRVARLRGRRGVTSFLYYVLSSPAFVRHILVGGQTGTQLPHISGSRIESFEFPLAPSMEQRRIVEALESYFSRLDDAVTTLERVERNLKRYRASVLKSAVDGRLVPTEAALAKEEGRDYEPASVLLERILTERRHRWSESGKKIRYQEPTPPDATNLPDLPEGWCWTTVDSLIWDADYGTSQKCTYEAAGPPVLRIPNVQEQALRLTDLKFATAPRQLDAGGAVEVGDLIFIRTNGSRNLIGRGAVVLESLPTPHYFASYLIRLRVLPVGVLPRWVGFIWHTPLLREQILNDAASSAGQYNVSMKAASRFVVPLAPEAEQRRILQEAERLDSLAEATLVTVATAVERSARLRQMILRWAFDGRLVDQDVTDEPASILLERMKNDRETAKPLKATRPRISSKKSRV
jgi:type I restriction enzyme, S subunit